MATLPESGREEGLLRVIIRDLLIATSVAFALASLIHFGVSLDLGPVTITDPFPGAAIPEAIIAITLGVSSAFVFADWPGSWGVALGASLFALVLTIFGLSVTVHSSRTADIVYHVVVLVALVSTVGMLLLARRGRGWLPPH